MDDLSAERKGEQRVGQKVGPLGWKEQNLVASWAWKTAAWWAAMTTAGWLAS